MVGRAVRLAALVMPRQPVQHDTRAEPLSRSPATKPMGVARLAGAAGLWQLAEHDHVA